MDWKEAKGKAVREIVDTLDTDEMVRLYNEMAERRNYTLIQENTDDVLDELFESPSDAIRAASGSDYNYGHDYLYYDVYFESFDHWSDKNSPIVASEITDFIVDSGCGFGVIEEGHSDLIDAICEWAGELIDGEFADWLVGEDLLYEDWDSLYESWKESKEEDEDGDED